MRIAVDAMGGDRAPREVVAGALLAADEYTDDAFVLVGDEEAVRSELSRRKDTTPSNISVIHAPEVMGMEDAPIEAVRGKRQSSVTVSVKLVADGKAEAVISAGNTGAAVAAATVLLKPLSGVKRSGIAVSFPTHSGTTTLIDVGANIHCRPVHLLQYAIMATVYSEQILGISTPRVGLMNIGAESRKGNELVRETRRLLEEHPHVNFVGNIEGYDIYTGVCDVAVCEGDASEYGGAPLLGVDGICIIGHGSSDARAIHNALRVARGFGGKHVNEHIAAAIQLDCYTPPGKVK